ncbi:hypothetical protein QQX98_005398 [Neonectria punicea]|uniref:Uncharacterized protein n=1 Tax=Neonectria punicea TaxID=979145 RepID=A0ABR1H572_9HYPO
MLESKRLLQSDLENICLENIQTCILVANLCACHSNPTSEALYFRIANSMAQITGLNTSATAGSIVMCEIKDMGEIVDLPMDESIFHSLSPDQESLEGAWKPGLWAHMISLVQHFGPIQDLNRRSALGNVDSDELDREVRHISQQIELWEMMLPTESKMTEQNLHLHQGKGTGGALVALHLGYHHYSTLLYFRFLEDQRAVTDLRKWCISRCKHHASAYSALLRQARREPGCEAVYPTVGHMAVVSSSVLLHILLFGDENELESARLELNANFEALIELKQYWPNMVSMEKQIQTVPFGIEMEPDNLFTMTQELTQQGRYTVFELSAPTVGEGMQESLG